MVIQEYFQQRVKNWFDTVGKIVFLVKHYWLRFEFAPGRGQIHAHCLLITNNIRIQKEAHAALRNAIERDMSDDFELERASIYQEWAEKRLCMTANLPSRYTTNTVPLNSKECHPASKRLREIIDIEEDGARFLYTTQNHVCTTYCMRKRTIL